MFQEAVTLGSEGGGGKLRAFVLGTFGGGREEVGVLNNLLNVVKQEMTFGSRFHFVVIIHLP